MRGTITQVIYSAKTSSTRALVFTWRRDVLEAKPRFSVFFPFDNEQNIYLLVEHYSSAFSALILQ